MILTVPAVAASQNFWNVTVAASRPAQSVRRLIRDSRAAVRRGDKRQQCRAVHTFYALGLWQIPQQHVLVIEGLRIASAGGAKIVGVELVDQRVADSEVFAESGYAG